MTIVVHRFVDNPGGRAPSLSKSPVQMAVIASSFGVISVFLGLMASFQWDLPSGPAIVLVASLFFIGTLPMGVGGRRG